MTDVVIFAILLFLACGAIACFGDVILRLIHREKNELRHLGCYRIMTPDEMLQVLIDSKIKPSTEAINEARKYYGGLQNYGSVSERREK